MNMNIVITVGTIYGVATSFKYDNDIVVLGALFPAIVIVIPRVKLKYTGDMDYTRARSRGHLIYFKRIYTRYSYELVRTRTLVITAFRLLMFYRYVQGFDHYDYYMNIKTFRITDTVIHEQFIMVGYPRASMQLI